MSKTASSAGGVIRGRRSRGRRRGGQGAGGPSLQKPRTRAGLSGKLLLSNQIRTPGRRREAARRGCSQHAPSHRGEAGEQARGGERPQTPAAVPVGRQTAETDSGACGLSPASGARSGGRQARLPPAPGPAEEYVKRLARRRNEQQQRGTLAHSLAGRPTAAEPAAAAENAAGGRPNGRPVARLGRPRLEIYLADRASLNANRGRKQAGPHRVPHIPAALRPGQTVEIRSRARNRGEKTDTGNLACLQGFHELSDGDTHQNNEQPRHQRESAEKRTRIKYSRQIFVAGLKHRAPLPHFKLGSELR